MPQDLKFDAQSGVESIRVNKLRLTLAGSKERITIEANTSRNPNAVYDLFEKSFFTSLNVEIYVLS